MKTLKVLGLIWLTVAGGALVLTMVTSAVSSASGSRSYSRSARPAVTRPAPAPLPAPPTRTTVTRRAASTTPPPSVSRNTTPRRSSSTVPGLSESTRRLVFLTLVRCQDNGSGNAHDTACMRTAERTYNITRSQLNRIIGEGIANRWPPLR